MANVRRWWGTGLGLVITLVVHFSMLVLHGDEGRVVAMWYLPAIVVASYLGGLWPGLVASVASAASALWLCAPVNSLAVQDPIDLQRAALLVVLGSICAATFERLHSATRRLAKSHEVELAGERAKAEAIAAHARLAELAHLVDASFWILDTQRGEMLYISPGYERIWGRSCADHMANPFDWLEIVHPDDRAALEVKSRSFDVAEGTVSEFRIVRADGEMRWISVRLYPIRNDEGQMIRLAGVCDDITARKNAELRAQTSNQRFQQLAESIQEVFWMRDVDNRDNFYVSPAYETIWGRSVETLCQRPSEWLDAIHPEDRPHVLDATTVLKAGGTYNERYRIIRPSGEVRWINDRAFPVLDENGTLIRVAGIADDITEQKHLQADLQQAQKLESIGLLAGGVAHDFNNILCVITANTELLLETLPEGPDRELLEQVQSSAERACSLTRQLLAFGRKQVVKPVVLDLNVAVEEARGMLRRVLGEDVELRVSLDPDIGKIRIDAAQMTQVLMNLCFNARDAIGPGGRIEIKTRSANDGVWLSVSDNGTGMTDAVKAHLFEPFFTTKGVGRGTGLGLSVVHGVVQQAGGQIELQSDLGRGTTFRLRFPQVADSVAAVAPRQARAFGKERILLVDDDIHLRKAASRSLKKCGYTVVEACDGADALRQLRERDGIDLLITDIVMPVMTGRELVETAAKEFPELRVLYTSGYTDDEIMRRGIMQADVQFLEKPFGTADLATKVRAVLDS